MTHHVVQKCLASLGIYRAFESEHFDKKIFLKSLILTEIDLKYCEQQKTDAFYNRFFFSEFCATIFAGSAY